MSVETSFDALLVRLRAGDEAAADEIFRRFAHRLIGLARSRLDPLVRRKVDPEDVLQSVLNSFFQRCTRGEWNLTGWDSLWGLLTVMTVRKCGREAQHYRAARRDVRREKSRPPAEDGSAPAMESLAREPTPAEAAALAETVEQMLSRLSERDRQIVLLHLQGQSGSTVAAEANCTQRTVRRVLERLARHLEDQMNEDDGSNTGDDTRE